MGIVDRIILLMEEKGITGVELAGVLQKGKSPVTDWKNGQSLPTLKQIIALCEYFAVSSDYLLFGRTPSEQQGSGNPSLSKDELQLIERYRSLDKDGQDYVRVAVLNEWRRMEQMQPLGVVTNENISATTSGRDQTLAPPNQSGPPFVKPRKGVPKKQPPKPKQGKAQ